MDEKLIIHCYAEKKSRVLSKPDFYQNSPMICLMVKREYYEGLLAYSKDHDMSDLEVTLSPWPENITERAVKMFFALRDNLAKHSGGTSPTGKIDAEYKRHLYKECLKSCEFGKDSIKDLTKRELWILTTTMKEWCEDAECDIRNLTVDYKSIQEEVGLMYYKNAVNEGADLRHLQVDYKVNQGEK